MSDQPYTLARWHVRAGHEEAFVAAWHELAAVFLSLKAPPRWGTLLRSVEDPRLFYSFGPWPSIIPPHEVVDTEQQGRRLSVDGGALTRGHQHGTE